MTAMTALLATGNWQLQLHGDPCDRNLDDAVRDRLRQRSAEHGHSMEEEVRQILRQVVEPSKPVASTEGLGSRIHNHFARLGGVELELQSRSDTTSAPDLNL